MVDYRPVVVGARAKSAPAKGKAQQGKVSDPIVIEKQVIVEVVKEVIKEVKVEKPVEVIKEVIKEIKVPVEKLVV